MTARRQSGFAAHPGLRQEDSALYGDHGSVGTIVGLQLRQNILDPTFHSLLGDGEPSADFLIRVAVRNELQDFHFPIRQRFIQ